MPVPVSEQTKGARRACKISKVPGGRETIAIPDPPSTIALDSCKQK